MHPDHNESPFHALPTIVVIMAVVIGGLELLFSAAEAGFLGGNDAIGWRLQAIRDYGFSDPAFDWMLINNTFPAEHMLRFLTYPLIHFGFTHAVFVVVFILAIGKMVATAFPQWALPLIFWASSIGGACVFGLVFQTQVALVGGYPGVYGLIGAFTFLMWVSAGVAGENRYRAFTLIGFLLGIQLLFAILFGSSGDWLADLVGFAVGFALSFLLIPGGWARIRSHLRRR